MPNAWPTPNYADAANCSYWANYFEYLYDVANGDIRTGTKATNSNLGYSSYVEFMMYYGRDASATA